MFSAQHIDPLDPELRNLGGNEANRQGRGDNAERRSLCRHDGRRKVLALLDRHDSVVALDRFHVQADGEVAFGRLEAGFRPIAQMDPKFFQRVPLRHVGKTTVAQYGGQAGMIEDAFVEVVLVVLPAHQGKLDQVEIVAVSLIDRHQTVKVRNRQAQHTAYPELLVEVAQDLADFLEREVLQYVAHVDLADGAVSKFIQGKALGAEVDMRRLACIDADPSLDIDRPGSKMDLQSTVAGLGIDGFVAAIACVMSADAERPDLGGNSGNEIQVEVPNQ